MSALTASERIDIVHHKNRPTIHDYIPLLFDEFCELHGDRLFGDDCEFPRNSNYGDRRGKGAQFRRKQAL